jgi:hypothetical protein
VIARLGALVRPLRRIARVLRTTRSTIASVPDVVEAILVLPTLSRQLDVIALSTSTLPEMNEEIVRLRGDVRSLGVMDERLSAMCGLLAQVQGNTSAVEQLVELATPLRGAAVRIGHLNDRFPQRRRPLVRSIPRPDPRGPGR